MWKTEQYAVGVDNKLDAPNENAVIDFIPLMWLPGALNKQVIARLQSDELMAESLDSNKLAEGIDARYEGIAAVIPHLVARWTLKDPYTGALLPSPRDMQGSGDFSLLKSIPIQILIDVLNMSVTWGQQEAASSVIEIDGPSDPDAASGAAQGIPFANEPVSDLQSSLVLVPTN